MASWRQGALVSKSKTRSPGSSQDFQGKTPDSCPEPPEGPNGQGLPDCCPFSALPLGSAFLSFHFFLPTFILSS